MPHFFPDEFLRRLRNEIPMADVFRRLSWPHKRRQGQTAFLCPRCQEYLSAVNPRTNLGRCFYCHSNFNPIDFMMFARECDFVTAVNSLTPLLPNSHRDDAH